LPITSCRPRPPAPRQNSAPTAGAFRWCGNAAHRARRGCRRRWPENGSYSRQDLEFLLERVMLRHIRQCQSANDPHENSVPGQKNGCQHQAGDTRRPRNSRREIEVRGDAVRRSWLIRWRMRMPSVPSCSGVRTGGDFVGIAALAHFGKCPSLRAATGWRAKSRTGLKRSEQAPRLEAATRHRAPGF